MNWLWVPPLSRAFSVRDLAYFLVPSPKHSPGSPLWLPVRSACVPQCISHAPRVCPQRVSPLFLFCVLSAPWAFARPLRCVSLSPCVSRAFSNNSRAFYHAFTTLSVIKSLVVFFAQRFPAGLQAYFVLPFAFVAYSQRYAGRLIAIFSRCVPHAYPGAFPVYGSTFSMYSK